MSGDTDQLPDFLMWVRRILQGPVSALGVRPFAQRVYRRLLQARYGKDGLAHVRHNGRVWKLNTEVALRGEYAEFDTVEWLRSVVKPGDCVIDVGANVGQMTLEAALLAGPAGKVIAIEPAPGNVKMLRTHVDANGFADWVDIVKAACGAESGGTITLHILGDDINAIGSGHNVFQPTQDGRWTDIAVPRQALDDLCRERGLRPAVIKIDVEGAELEVLRGCQEVLKRMRPQVRFGFHPFAFSDPVQATRDIRNVLASCEYNAPPPPPDGAYELAEYSATPASHE